MVWIHILDLYDLESILFSLKADGNKLGINFINIGRSSVPPGIKNMVKDGIVLQISNNWSFDRSFKSMKLGIFYFFLISRITWLSNSKAILISSFEVFKGGNNLIVFSAAPTNKRPFSLAMFPKSAAV